MVVTTQYYWLYITWSRKRCFLWNGSKDLCLQPLSSHLCSCVEITWNNGFCFSNAVNGRLSAVDVHKDDQYKWCLMVASYCMLIFILFQALRSHCLMDMVGVFLFIIKQHFVILRRKFGLFPDTFNQVNMEHHI